MVPGTQDEGGRASAGFAADAELEKGEKWEGPSNDGQKPERAWSWVGRCRVFGGLLGFTQIVEGLCEVLDWWKV